MHKPQRTILLKLSGEVFGSDGSAIEPIVTQLRILRESAIVGIVIGAGNLWRGNTARERLNIDTATADEIGMLATVMNARTLQFLLERAKVPNMLMSALACPNVAQPISQHLIDQEKSSRCIIFAGGSGNPFFTTDTAAVIRALQLGATEVWKATTVDGIYDSDPRRNKHAQKLAQVTYDHVLSKGIEVMDSTAMTLARAHKLVIRVFDLSSPNGLVRAYQEPNFGSTIHV